MKQSISFDHSVSSVWDSLLLDGKPLFSKKELSDVFGKFEETAKDVLAEGGNADCAASICFRVNEMRNQYTHKEILAISFMTGWVFPQYSTGFLKMTTKAFVNSIMGYKKHSQALEHIYSDMCKDKKAEIIVDLLIIQMFGAFYYIRTHIKDCLKKLEEETSEKDKLLDEFMNNFRKN